MEGPHLVIVPGPTWSPPKAGCSALSRTSSSTTSFLTVTLKVQHHGAQPHFLDIMKGPASLTKLSKDQLIELLSAPAGATPAPGLPSQREFQPVFFSPTQSLGTVTWHPLTLAAGAYLAVCFFPTAGTGVPHAMNGMVDVFTVTG